jgi:hypothetical protein
MLYYRQNIHTENIVNHSPDEGNVQLRKTRLFS